jgi:hypothetical protein
MENKKQIIINAIKDTVLNFIAYDRKNDENLPKGEIEKAISEKEITENEIFQIFKDELQIQLKMEQKSCDCLERLDRGLKKQKLSINIMYDDCGNKWPMMTADNSPYEKDPKKLQRHILSPAVYCPFCGTKYILKKIQTVKDPKEIQKFLPKIVN